MKFRLFLILLIINPFSSAIADIVKPALIEISVYTTNQVRIEIRASLEALMTGINARYRNTNDAPNAEQYDELRQQSSADLEQSFVSFHQALLDGVELKLDDLTAELKIEKINIPAPGYTKVPRISVIILTGDIPRDTEQLTWYYPSRFGDQAVRVRQVDEANEEWHWSSHQWIKDDVPSEPFPLNEVFTRPSLWEVIQTYTGSGYQHILPLGLDHILFIFGIFLLSRKLKPLLLQVTMFTLAHSITLTLGMLEIVSLSARIVEPLIALSIAYIAIENIFFDRISRARLWVIFGFGLLHGMGFASVLADFGMPKDAFALALLCFNIGVELGQVTIILAGFYGLAVWFKSAQVYRQWIVVPLSIMISVTGLIWFVERLEWVY